MVRALFLLVIIVAGAACGGRTPPMDDDGFFTSAYCTEELGGVVVFATTDAGVSCPPLFDNVGEVQDRAASICCKQR